MANWSAVIRICDLIDKVYEDKNLCAFGEGLAERVEAAVPALLRDGELDDILQSLRNADCMVDETEANYYLEQLYDWGDRRHRLFVSVFESPPKTEASSARSAE